MFIKMIVAILCLMVAVAVSQLTLEEFDPRDTFGFNLHESGRQMMDIKKADHREFRKMRQQNRQHPHEWGLGDTLVDNAIVMGEVSCRLFMAFGDNYPFPHDNEINELQINSVRVFNTRSGYEYPVVIRGNDFVAYHPDLQSVHGRNYITIKIKHTGCIPLPRECYAETTYSSSYKYNGDTMRLMFVEMNLATKSYTEDCSVIRKVFNFWPFYYLF